MRHPSPTLKKGKAKAPQGKKKTSLKKKYLFGYAARAQCGHATEVTTRLPCSQPP
jgi:hypothetical protein